MTAKTKVDISKCPAALDGRVVVVAVEVMAVLVSVGVAMPTNRVLLLVALASAASPVPIALALPVGEMALDEAAVESGTRTDRTAVA